CSSGLPTEPVVSWCWHKKRLACSTTTTSGP
ncbi:MAG: ATP-dependent Clp protease, ATP-binding subunit ClpC, partial [uncultured Friedmanniella sp.]